MRAGETCSKGGSEGQKSGEKNREKGKRELQRQAETQPKVTSLCRPIVSLLYLAFHSETRLVGSFFFPTDRFHEAPRSETVAA